MEFNITKNIQQYELVKIKSPVVQDAIKFHTRKKNFRLIQENYKSYTFIFNETFNKDSNIVKNLSELFLKLMDHKKIGSVTLSQFLKLNNYISSKTKIETIDLELTFSKVSKQHAIKNLDFLRFILSLEDLFTRYELDIYILDTSQG